MLARRSDKGGSAPAPIPAEPGTDWAWRPPFWTQAVDPSRVVAAASPTTTGAGVKIFHDSDVSEITLEQIEGPGSPLPYALALSIDGFDGEFLSVAVDLPVEAIHGLTMHHLIEVRLTGQATRSMTIYGRLNVQHGPNAAALVQQAELTTDIDTLDFGFDLAFTELNEARLERAWLDLIVDRPADARLRFSDLTLTRRPRAET